MQPVQYVDLNRFMGQWHVIADVETLFDKGALNPMEHYELNDDGSINTMYSFSREGKPERRKMKAKGFVTDQTSNAIWGMQFVWPIKADYRIVYLDEDYTTTIIARQKRDFVWIMSRTPTIEAARLDELLAIVASLGYDIDELRIHQPLPGLETKPLGSAAGAF